MEGRAAVAALKVRLPADCHNNQAWDRVSGTVNRLHNRTPGERDPDRSTLWNTYSTQGLVLSLAINVMGNEDNGSKGTRRWVGSPVGRQFYLTGTGESLRQRSGFHQLSWAPPSPALQGDSGCSGHRPR